MSILLKLRKRSTHCGKVNVVSALVSAIIAVFVLIGWTFNIEILKRIVPGLVAMNPMTAVAFLLVAISLALYTGEKSNEPNFFQVWVARACAGAVIFIGIAKVVAILGGPDLHVDQCLFSSKLAVGFRMPNVMAPNTALNFFLVGNALLLIHSRKRRASALACIAALVCGFEALLAILGYVYGIGAFYGLHAFIPMALHTALGFLVVSFGIMACQADRGFLAMLLGDNVGGAMARRLLPAAILVPSVMGWLRLEGQRIGLYDSDFGVAIYTVTNMLVFGLLVAWNAHLLFKTDSKRAKADLHLRRANDELQAQIKKQAATNQKLEAIVAVQQEIGTSDVDLQAVMTLIAERTQSLTDATGAVVELAEGDEMVYTAASGTVTAHLGTRLKIDNSFSGLCFRGDKTLLCDDAETDARVNREACRRIGVRSMIAAPLRAAKKTVGVLKVLSSLPSVFAHEDVMALQAMAGLMGTAIYRKQAESKLLEGKRELEAAVHANQLIMDNSRDVICTVDEEGRFITMSAASEALWGYKPEELRGRAYIDMVHPDDRAKTNDVAARIINGSAVSDFENRYLRKDGSVIHVMWSAYWSPEDRIMFAVAHNITERAQTEKELKEAKAEADRANRAKSEFLSRMSHELRTPMNAILGFAQLLEMENLTADQQESVGHISRGGRHLLELINEVLDISRIEAGRLSLSPEPVQLAEALHETIDLVRPLASDRAVRIAYQEHGELYVLADRQRLKQVLINLISNSIKYNRTGGSVTLSCEPRNGCARVLITDTGQGIPAERMEQLFVPFERLGAEQSSIEGTGLGLAVAKRLAEAMQGSIGVESVPGQGSTFWLELPLTQSPIVRAKLLEEEADVIQIDLSEKRHVLYIEDNLSNLRLIERVLRRRPSITLHTAGDGREGLKFAAEKTPDLILLDLNLPDIHGHEVLSRLQSDPRCVGIPVIVISADAMLVQRKRLLEAGAREYLSKPLNIQKFFDVLDCTLATARQSAPSSAQS